jgi:hypothetical protein
MDTIAFIEVFLGRPRLSFVVGGIFIVLGFILLRKEELHRGSFVNVTGALWIFYGLYEYLLVTIFNVPPGSASFRCDMIIIFPLLGFTTLASVWHVYSGWR